MRFPKVTQPFRARVILADGIGVARVLCMHERERQREREETKRKKKRGSDRSEGSEPTQAERDDRKKTKKIAAKAGAAVLSTPDRLAGRGGKKKPGAGPKKRREG